MAPVRVVLVDTWGKRWLRVVGRLRSWGSFLNMLQHSQHRDQEIKVEGGTYYGDGSNI